MDLVVGGPISCEVRRPERQSPGITPIPRSAHGARWHRSTVGNGADRYRGILTERGAAVPGALLDCPWPALEPADFKPGAADGSGGPTLPHRTMTAGEVAALKLTGIEGGVQGLAVKGPDGKRYAFILRPLLADEKE